MNFRNLMLWLPHYTKNIVRKVKSTIFTKGAKCKDYHLCNNEIHQCVAILCRAGTQSKIFK